MKVIGIGGLPASGKSTLVKKLRNKLGKPKLFKYGLVRGENYDNVYMLGQYNKKFGGTDTLSMAVQPHAEKFLEAMKDKDCVIFYEGDRLFNDSFISYIVKMKCKYSFYMLIAKPDEIERRHIERNDTQSEKWKKGRETKYKRLFEKYMRIIVLLNNENNDDLKTNEDIIWQDLKNIT